jgi:hypothetical protein
MGIKRGTAAPEAEQTRVGHEGQLDGFVERLLAELPVPPPGLPHVRPSFTRRYKAKTISGRCGVRRLHAPLLKQLASRLAHEGIHTDRMLTAPGLKADDWVRFARIQFPPDRALFPREHLLQQFLRAAVGTFGPLKNLRLIKEQYRLSTGGRIDLLCEDASRDRRGALVAIELKRDTDQRTMQQVVSYLQDLRRERLAEGRRGVRAIVISGDEDRVGRDLAKVATEFDIQWYRYSVSLERV